MNVPKEETVDSMAGPRTDVPVYFSELQPGEKTPEALAHQVKVAFSYLNDLKPEDVQAFTICVGKTDGQCLTMVAGTAYEIALCMETLCSIAERQVIELSK